MHKTGMFFRIITFIALSTILGTLLFADEVTAVWERTYRQAVSDEQRYAVMLKIMEMKNKDFAPLISESLDKLYVSKIETADSYRTKTKLALAKLLVQELGNLRSLDDAQLVLNVYLAVKDPFLKGEAAIALGKMRSLMAIEILSRDLADINLRPDQANSRPQEILAYGLVQGLELMHSPIGFESVFFASVAWYSVASQVKETAKSATKTMIDDPSTQLKTIILKDTALDHKLRAIEAIDESSAPATAKTELGRIGLDQGLTIHGTSVLTNTQLSDIRTKSIKLLIASNDKSPETVALFQRMIEFKYNFDELLLTYVALGKNGSDAAIDQLISRMRDFNEKQQTGKNTPDDRKLIMQVIQSLKESGNAKAKSVLVDAQFSDHDGTVARAAADAAAALP